MSAELVIDVPDQTEAKPTSTAAPSEVDAAAGTEADVAELSERTYLGVVKSYNDRRGFGFVACAEIVAQHGRDVYLPKAEAALAQAAELETEKMAEDDILQFRVRLSVEGYPQAAEVKKLRKLRGTVASVPSAGASGCLRCEELSEDAIELRAETIGQLCLVEGDVVSFCLAQGDVGLAREAQLVCLEQTKRPVASVLGLFCARLPRDKQRADLSLQCHAFADKVVATGLPADATEAELLHFFSKQGATGVSVTSSAGGESFAAAVFPSIREVSRLLGSPVHAFADDVETKVGAVLPGAPLDEQPSLPALPRPTLAPGKENGELLISWSPSVIATEYAVEIRAPVAQGSWSAIDDSTGNMRRSECSSCKVTGMPTDAAFEVRVLYTTSRGTKSDASEASPSCKAVPMATRAQEATAASIAAAASAANANFQLQAAVGMVPPVAWPSPDVVSAMVGGTMPHSQQEVTLSLAQALQAGTMPAGIAPAVQPCAPRHAWPCAPGASLLPVQAPVPEVRWADETGTSVLVQWMPVPNAAGYVVELSEGGGTASERFTRSAVPSAPGMPLDLQIGGLRPAAPGCCYAAQIRVVTADGCESAPSAPGWAQMPQAVAMQPMVQQCFAPASSALPHLLRSPGQPLAPAPVGQAAKTDAVPMVAVPIAPQGIQPAPFGGFQAMQPQAAGGLILQGVAAGAGVDPFASGTAGSLMLD